MEKGMNKNILIAGGVLLVIIFFVGGFFIGQSTGRTEGRELGQAQYKSVVETIYPKPPEVINSITGKVTNIYGASIQVEVNDPEDYLPHTDGTPRVKQTRLANTTPDTKYLFVDYTKFDKSGLPTQSNGVFSDIKIGDTVMVESTENILTEKRFDVTKVTLVKY